MTPGVAVVITCHEVGKTLPDAVASVLKQTMPPAEVLVVDDGSRHALTLHELARLDRDEPRVRVVRSEHRGPAEARDLGVGLTTAPLVVLLDGDDKFEPKYLERATQILTERDDLGFVCCAVQAFGGTVYRWKPPPYTFAEALGRGVCGHISTVFRRTLWEAVGGFDPGLPAFEDVDFWLRALEYGFRGVILDEPLFLHRIRRGSRRHGAFARGGYLDAKRRLLENHLAGCSRGEDIFITLLEFEREARSHARALLETRSRLGRSLAQIEVDIALNHERLAARDIPPLDFGPSANRQTPQPAAQHSPVEEHLMNQALADLGPERHPRRTLKITHPNGWTGTQSRQADLIEIVGVLEYDLEPAASLARCRDLLRPGGQLIVATAAMATGANRYHGVGEAALRALLSELFPPETIRIRTYGNVLTSLASASGAPLSSLTDDELSMVDDDHPTVVAGAAVLPSRARRPGLRRHRPSRGREAPLRPPEPGAAIVAYHRIADHAPDSHGLCTPADVFRAHMEVLARDFRPTSLTALAVQVATADIVPRSVAVIFDDGYADNHEIASPILTELGIPATFFVIGVPSDVPTEPWWDTIESILLGSDKVPDRLRLATASWTLDLSTGDEPARTRALKAIHLQLLRAPQEEVDETVGNLRAWSGLEIAARQSHRLMSRQEVVELSSRPGHSVGAHTIDHESLPTLTADRALDQMRRSKLGLEHLVERPVELLAYPYGACNASIADAAEATGFVAACTTEPGPITGDSDPLRLPRLELSRIDAECFGLMLTQALCETP